jgi:hypothetical protein
VASVKSIGGACGVGTPTLTATPPLLGTTQNYSITGAAANAGVLLMLAPITTSVGIGNGCTLHVGGNPLLLPAGNTNANGQWNFGLKIPNAKDLLGAAATVQSAVLTAAGPALGIAELTNGLEVVGGV